MYIIRPRSGSHMPYASHCSIVVKFSVSYPPGPSLSCIPGSSWYVRPTLVSVEQQLNPQRLRLCQPCLLVHSLSSRFLHSLFLGRVGTSSQCRISNGTLLPLTSDELILKCMTRLGEWLISCRRSIADITFRVVVCCTITYVRDTVWLLISFCWDGNLSYLSPTSTLYYIKQSAPGAMMRWLLLHCFFLSLSLLCGLLPSHRSIRRLLYRLNEKQSRTG